MRRDYRERLYAAARALMHERAMLWPAALEAAKQSLQCGAKTRAGTPCKRKGIGKGGRCIKHAGASTGPRTPEGRARISQLAKARPRVPAGNKWMKVSAIQATT